MKILLIEDNKAIATQLMEFLAAHDCDVDYAERGKHGIELALNEIFDVILLDLNLPDIDGLQVCEQIKQQAVVIPAILMLTARDSYADKAAGFGLGADDYLSKPFDLRELLLRCQALARRNQLHRSQQLNLGSLQLDLGQQQASREGQSLKLTSIGFQILSLLVESYPQPVSRSLLSHKLWSDSPPDSDALKSHIYSLRKALDKPFDKPMLKTVMNLGYKLELANDGD
ncbi:response regulator transcription factor [uncultured Pseudoteredinibacter sp.]|uniref:response regulator transcription factor n=1 Tax=uncultured Pseudoteredinibacter sp. TaxID=1641701 RepID=UPI002635FE05|nr:response regulator transcription factor [uncultured Pseudoteredinibacter sp.]